MTFQFKFYALKDFLAKKIICLHTLKDTTIKLQRRSCLYELTKILHPPLIAENYIIIASICRLSLLVYCFSEIPFRVPLDPKSDIDECEQQLPIYLSFVIDLVHCPYQLFYNEGFIYARSHNDFCDFEFFMQRL